MAPIQITLVLNLVFLKVLFLFLIYINDLERDVKSNAIADDTMFVSMVNDPELSAYDLNHDIDIIRHEKTMKANKNVGIIKHLFRFLPSRHLTTCIKHLFAPILIIVKLSIIYHQNNQILVLP